MFILLSGEHVLPLFYFYLVAAWLALTVSHVHTVYLLSHDPNDGHLSLL